MRLRSIGQTRGQSVPVPHKFTQNSIVRYIRLCARRILRTCAHDIRKDLHIFCTQRNRRLFEKRDSSGALPLVVDYKRTKRSPDEKKATDSMRL